MRSGDSTSYPGRLAAQQTLHLLLIGSVIEETGDQETVPVTQDVSLLNKHLIFS